MKAPICSMCTNSEVLCAGCNEKLQRGEITQNDVDISRLLFRLEKTFSLHDVDFRKSIDINGFILILTSGDVASLIGRHGRVVRLISQELGKWVRIVNVSGPRTIVQDLVYPARVYGMNILNTPEGEEYKVIVPKEDRRKLVMDDESLNKALDVLLNKKAEIKFR
jgi:transcription antitermination factor NusA-like protein